MQTRCQGPKVEVDLGQQVLTMIRALYNTKHKLPAEVKFHHTEYELFLLAICR